MKKNRKFVAISQLGIAKYQGFCFDFQSRMDTVPNNCILTPKSVGRDQFKVEKSFILPKSFIETVLVTQKIRRYLLSIELFSSNFWIFGHLLAINYGVSK